jgi:predicted ArsR family transcriptional regulator
VAVHLNGNAYLLLRAIADHHDQEVSIKSLMDETGLARSTVKRHLPVLRLHGLIDYSPLHAHGIGRGNNYRFQVKGKAFTTLKMVRSL